MTRMVRQQMICIVAPGWPGNADLPVTKKELDDLFKDVGVVHFASIALLPALPGAQKPSLMLELVIEEGLEPDDLFDRLVNHPSDTMWSLYGAFWENPPSSTRERNQDLLDRLKRWRSIADGAFVGARDRSVRQIKQEKKLLEHTREEARRLKAIHNDRESLALALSRWAFGNPQFEWAQQPAPRSYWRGKGASISAKLAYPAVAIGLWFGFFWLFGVLARAFGLPKVSEASRSVIAGSCRFLIALVVVGVALWLFFGVLPALFEGWRRWLASLNRELDRPTNTLSSLTTTFMVRAVVLLLVPWTLWCIGVYTFYPKLLYAKTIGLLLPASPSGTQIAIAIISILVVVGIGVVFAYLDRLLPGLNDRFYRAHEDDVLRAQQVHPSIDKCEAELARETAHMVSLTDMRSPNGWSAWWTRASLRLVTLFGRVIFTEGRLGTAPGIHFGHWHIIDGGRRYLFCSNYDGNFGGYLDDFINGAPAGTNLSWRWTKLISRPAAADGHPAVSAPRAFPPTRFLIFRGVKCELKFKSYARDSMLPHLYRFDACKATIDDINRATVLRNALFGERNDCNDDQIMRAIES